MSFDEPALDQLANAIRAGLAGHRNFSTSNDEGRPDRSSVKGLCQRLLSLFFPGYFSDELFLGRHIGTFMRHHLVELEALLARQVRNALRYHAASCGDVQQPRDLQACTQEMLAKFFQTLPAIAELVTSDVDAAFGNDPAAANREEILVSYPCLEAITIQRIAHQLYRLGVPLLPRMMTETAHSHTGIDINPGATIGRSFFIDHGTGVVIGETCEIGEHCVLYHGVTLGAFNPLARNEQGDLNRGIGNKRHPTLEDRVIVYPGATILGGDTVIGAHSVIGGNVWLTHNVEPHSVVTLKDPELRIKSRHPAGNKA